jgi:hypothetical protein
MPSDPIWGWIAVLAVVVPFIPPAVWVCARVEILVRHALDVA